MEHPNKVLIVEDEPLVAVVIEAIVAGLGDYVGHSVHSKIEALQRIDRARYVAAIVDCVLADGDCEPVVQALDRKGVPYLIVSGHPADRLVERFPNNVILQKPFRAGELENAIRLMLSIEAARRSIASLDRMLSR